MAATDGDGGASDAEGIVSLLQAFTRPVPEIVLYTTQWCGYCVRATSLLDSLGLDYEQVALDDDPAFRQRVYDLGRRWTVPLVVIDGEVIGGYDELAGLRRSGALGARSAA